MGFVLDSLHCLCATFSVTYYSELCIAITFILQVSLDQVNMLMLNIVSKQPICNLLVKNDI